MFGEKERIICLCVLHTRTEKDQRWLCGLILITLLWSAIYFCTLKMTFFFSLFSLSLIKRDIEPPTPLRHGLSMGWRVSVTHLYSVSADIFDVSLGGPFANFIFKRTLTMMLTLCWLHDHGYPVLPYGLEEWKSSSSTASALYSALLEYASDKR